MNRANGAASSEMGMVHRLLYREHWTAGDLELVHTRDGARDVGEGLEPCLDQRHDLLHALEARRVGGVVRIFDEILPPHRATEIRPVV